jgi:phospho-N-acetylmuramoyl-pentapeptide-transferase
VTIAISLALWFVATHEAHLQSTLRLRFVDYTVDLGPFYPLLIYLVVAGTTSAVNLTDGLDGLAAGCAAIVLLAYIGITFITSEYNVSNQYELSMLAACLVGGCIGFLWFNAFPATIFMGDTGALGLGGAIAGLAVMTKTEVLLILLGGIFVFEALSVVIQVAYFQWRHKRVFLMAPIHHHFELRGWSETKIILRFWIIAAICCAIGFTIYRQSLG